MRQARDRSQATTLRRRTYFEEGRTGVLLPPLLLLLSLSLLGGDA